MQGLNTWHLICVLTNLHALRAAASPASSIQLRPTHQAHAFRVVPPCRVRRVADSAIAYFEQLSQEQAPSQQQVVVFDIDGGFEGALAQGGAYACPAELTS